eukprot:scaffold3217_cov111-Ochromonas_danica.AAC.1
MQQKRSPKLPIDKNWNNDVFEARKVYNTLIQCLNISVEESLHLKAVKAKAIEWTGLLWNDPMADILWEIAQEDRSMKCADEGKV